MNLELTADQAWSASSTGNQVFLNTNGIFNLGGHTLTASNTSVGNGLSFAAGKYQNGTIKVTQGLVRFDGWSGSYINFDGVNLVAEGATARIVFYSSYGGRFSLGAGGLTTTLNAGATLELDLNNIFNGSGGLFQGTLTGTGGDIYAVGGGILGSITGSGEFNFTRNSNITLGTDNSAFTGTINVNQGTLTVNTATGTNENISWSVAATKTLTFSVAGDIAAKAVTGTGTLGLSNAGAKTLTLGSDGADTGFGGTLNETGGAAKLVKTGTNMLTLSGTSNHTGGTEVAEGTLAATSAALGSGNVAVRSGATLEVTGNVSNLALLEGGATVDATGSVTLAASGAVLDIVLGTTAAQIAASGAVDISDLTLNLDDTGAGLLAPGDYNVLSVGNGFTGTFLNYTDGYSWETEGVTLTLRYDYGVGNAYVTVVPEPSTYAMFGAAGLAGCVLARRRRR